MTGVVIVKAATSTGTAAYWEYEQGQQPIVPITLGAMCVEELGIE
jgi:hypothetical protein